MTDGILKFDPVKYRSICIYRCAEERQQQTVNIVGVSLTAIEDDYPFFLLR